MGSLQEATARTRNWLNANFAEDGKCSMYPDEAQFYYKIPYFMVKAGLREKGAAVARYIRDNLVQPSGDLAGPPTFDLPTRIYAMGWVALGAVMVESFDLARRVVKRLSELQDPGTGAFVWSDAEAGGKAGDLQTAGGASMGLVAAGKLDNARLLADRFAKHLSGQPDRSRLSFFFRGDGSAIGAMPSGRLRTPYDPNADQQLPAALAPLVIGLVWFARATGDQQYLEIAERYVNFVYSGAYNPATFARTTKFGWAMLELYKDTGNQTLLKRAQELAEVLVSWQADDGLWDPRPARAGYTEADRINYAADCAMTVLTVAAGMLHSVGS